jgi:hypothetical protein
MRRSKRSDRVLSEWIFPEQADSFVGVPWEDTLRTTNHFQNDRLSVGAQLGFSEAQRTCQGRQLAIFGLSPIPSRRTDAVTHSGNSRSAPPNDWKGNYPLKTHH